MKFSHLALWTGTLLMASSVEARMYQWVNPDTGSMQLSGSAPAWYRDAAGGPRVFVFENGQLIDDTAVSVPESQREQLRAAARLGGEPDAQAGADRQVADLKRAFEQAAEKGVDISAIAAEFSAEQAAAADGGDETNTAQTVAELKALLDAWDRAREGQAKSLLERAEPDTPGALPPVTLPDGATLPAEPPPGVH